MRRVAFGLGALLVLASGWEYATVLAAQQLEPRSLEAPLWRLGPYGLFAPWKWASWTFAFGGRVPPALKPAELLGWGTLGLTALLCLAARLSRPARKESDAHGSARWATEREIREAGLGHDGVVLCQTADARYERKLVRGIYQWVLRRVGELICDNTPGHVAAYAATRSGKGVGICLPTCYVWRGSALIHDIKRELWALSAGWRSRFSRCLRFEPTAEHSVHYNPLFEIPRGEGDVREAMNVATTLCGTHDEGRKEGEHWKLTATDLIVGGILHVLYAGELKSLTGVRELLASSGRTQEEILRTMLLTPHLGDRPHPQIVAYATAGLNMSENERSGVFSTAISHLGVFLDPIISRNTNDSDFCAAQLNTYGDPISLYLVVPPSDKERLKPLFRLIINQITQILTREVDTHRPQPRVGLWQRLLDLRHHVLQLLERAATRATAAKHATKHRLLYLLDEFDSLGKMPALAAAMAHVAGYGIKMLIILQSPEQLWATYGRHNAVLDNASTQLAFGVNSLETARMLSALIGQRTEVTTRTSRSRKLGSLWYDSESTSDGEHGRALLTPDEIRTMPADEVVLLAGGVHPYRGKKVMYYLDPRFRDCAAWPPPDSVQAQAAELPQRPSNPWRDLAPIQAPASASIRSPKAEPPQESMVVHDELADASACGATYADEDLGEVSPW
jgi:type IV secretion system protein VirD4